MKENQKKPKRLSTTTKYVDEFPWNRLPKPDSPFFWPSFEICFKRVYPDFIDQLMELYPQLTLSDQRICAFIKLGISIKGTAEATGKSSKSIEVARSRMRKKIGLEAKTDLHKFLQSI